MPLRNSEHANDSAMPTVMPPYLVIGGFLEEDAVASLLEFTLGHEHSFELTKVGRAGPETIRPEFRVSLGMRDLGPFKPILKSKLLALVPDLVAKLKTSPVNMPQLELQLEPAPPALVVPVNFPPTAISVPYAAAPSPVGPLKA